MSISDLPLRTQANLTRLAASIAVQRLDRIISDRLERGERITLNPDDTAVVAVREDCRQIQSDTERRRAEARA